MITKFDKLQLAVIPGSTNDGRAWYASRYSNR